MEKLFLDLFCDSSIASLVLLFEIAEVLAAVGYHLNKAAARMVILLVALQVSCEFVNASREHRNLNFRAAGVLIMSLAFLDDGLLFLRSEHTK